MRVFLDCDLRERRTLSDFLAVSAVSGVTGHRRYCMSIVLENVDSVTLIDLRFQARFVFFVWILRALGGAVLHLGLTMSLIHIAIELIIASRVHRLLCAITLVVYFSRI